MNISATDAVAPAIERTKKLLFVPFRFSFWWRMALVAMLTGQMGGNYNFNFPSNFGDYSRSKRSPDELLSSGPWQWPSSLEEARTYLLLIAFVILLGVALVLALMFISSVFRFILFDSVLSGECRIREGWARRFAAGSKFFRWQLLYSGITGGSLFMIVGIPALLAWRAHLFENPSEHLVVLILGGFTLLFVLLVVMLALSAVGILVTDILVPMIAFEDVPVFDGLARIRQMFEENKKDYLVYLVMRFVLLIAVALVFGILAAIIMVILLVPLALFGVAIGALLVAIGKMVALVVGIPLIVVAVLALLFVQALVMLPGAVFTKSYGMYWVGARYAPLRPYLYPPLPPAIPPPPAPATS